MNDLMENFQINPITIEVEEKEWDLFKNRDSELKDQKHPEMAREWLVRDRNGGQLHLPNHSS